MHKTHSTLAKSFKKMFESTTAFQSLTRWNSSKNHRNTRRFYPFGTKISLVGPESKALAAARLSKIYRKQIPAGSIEPSRRISAKRLYLSLQAALYVSRTRVTNHAEFPREKSAREEERDRAEGRSALCSAQELRGCGRERAAGDRSRTKIDKRRATMNQRPVCLDRLRDLAKDHAG